MLERLQQRDAPRLIGRAVTVGRFALRKLRPSPTSSAPRAQEGIDDLSAVANEKNDDRYEPACQTEHAANNCEPVLDSPEVWWRWSFRRRIASAGRELDLLGVPSLLSVAH